MWKGGSCCAIKVNLKPLSCFNFLEFHIYGCVGKFDEAGELNEKAATFLALLPLSLNANQAGNDFNSFKLENLSEI